MLHDKGTQRLIVVDAERRPVGVLTRGDVVRALASAQS
jgi:predicted transcriptional regulator